MVPVLFRSPVVALQNIEFLPNSWYLLLLFRNRSLLRPGSMPNASNGVCLFEAQPLTVAVVVRTGAEALPSSVMSSGATPEALASST